MNLVLSRKITRIKARPGLLDRLEGNPQKKSHADPQSTNKRPLLIFTEENISMVVKCGPTEKYLI